MKFGESLRKERELRGVTLEEISEHTKVHTRFLEAIEKDDLGALPAKAFAKGFLRSYARMVDLDEEFVLSNFEYFQHTEHKNGAGGETHKAPAKASGRFVFLMLFATIALLLLLVFLYSQGYIQF